MLDPDGGFYSTHDADRTPLRSGDDLSEGEGGELFVWTPEDIRKALGPESMPSWPPTVRLRTAVLRQAQHAALRQAQCMVWKPKHPAVGGRNIRGFVGGIDQRPALTEARRKLLEARAALADSGSP
jgi:uncharacterized protein YyaL (SSP411 family)